MSERISTFMLVVGGLSMFWLFTELVERTDDWLLSWPVLAFAILLWIWAALQFGLIIGGRVSRE